jgi:hypothetical protein
MLLLLLAPVLVLVTFSHRYLQRYAPSNAVIARLRIAPPRWRTAGLLVALGLTTLMAMHLLAEAVAAGAPSWLNLIVLILAWDSIRFELVAASVALRCAVGNCRTLWRQGSRQRERDRSRVVIG